MYFDASLDPSRSSFCGRTSCAGGSMPGRALLAAIAEELAEVCRDLLAKQGGRPTRVNYVGYERHSVLRQIV